MKIISPYVHGIIDYAVVVFLWLSPTLFGLSPFVATMTYVLGGVHLALTLLTDFRWGVAKVIPLRLHGLIELAVSIILVASPWIFGFSDNYTDRMFYILFGLAVLITFLLTNYQRKPVVVT